MYTYMWHRFARPAALVVATLLAVSCRDSVTPEYDDPGVPVFVESSPTTGDLTIATATTGDAPARYTFSASGPGGSATDTIGANATRTFPQVDTGDYTVELGDVPTNCTVSGVNPRTVTVPAGSAGSTTFEVTCTATVRITGLGAIGTSTSATPGSDRQEFDFEATDTPGGRVAVTDYSVVRDDGTPGRITVDPATDPATGITSFSRPFATCVRFGGIGRLDTGELFQFFIDACDNASPGAGADTFTITLPDRGEFGFTRSGTLTEGDIVLSTTEPSPTTGTLTIMTATTGEGIPAGYTLSVTTPDGTSTTLPFDATDSQTFTGIAAGDYTLEITDMPDNCGLVSGANPRTVTVPAGGSVSTTFSVNCTATTPPPVANFTFSCSGLTCNFDASSSTAQATATYSWNWGDATPAGSGKTASHTYASAGTRTVTLTVTDAGGSNSTTQSVTTVAPPVARFTFSCSGLTCTFDASSSTAQAAATYSWSWGDGTSAGSGKTVMHTYGAAGSYSVTLTVTDGGGSSTKTQTATVSAPNQPPVANFTFSCNGLACSFMSTSSDPDGTIAAYNWTFGDGGTSTAQNPSHTYAAGGTYTVKLTVTDNRGATASASKNVTVSQPNRAPTVNAGSDETVLLGLLYTLSASFTDPDNGPWSYTINWGDGSSTSGTKSSQGTISAGHNYLLIGRYTIKVTVVDSRGASGWDTKVLTVLAPLPGLP